eukprot:GHVR01096919.1.p1 GENE.GHVR01096919.1~~GHVR01096919.1.p1  ORF type:complete len:120 (+),score=1.56 GHVR01096919.1:195-554(+)
MFRWVPPNYANFTVDRDSWTQLRKSQGQGSDNRRFLNQAWMQIMKNGLRHSNPYCIFGFRKHRVKVVNSRKLVGLVFHCAGNCKYPCCNLQFEISIKSEESLLAEIQYTGYVCHGLGQQ